MTGKELLFGAVAAGLLLSGAAAPAFAAKGEGRHGPRHAAMIERLDANSDGKVSEAEMLQRASETFQRLDADKNGAVTKAEVDAKREAFHDARKAFREVKATDGEARDAAREALRDARIDRMGTRMFERADADKNGTLTKTEMETAAAAMFKQRDRNGDGFITTDEIGKRHK
jgi:Ca2+-binding EF-hand superfamily protein